MKKRISYQVFATLLLACLGGAILAGAQKNGAADVQLQAAIHKATVDGDLDQAIRMYKEIVSKYSANHAVAASALLHMGQAYEKLGSAEARKSYEQLIRNYADQKDAFSQARSHLAALEGARSRTSMSSRRIWESDGKTDLDVITGSTVSHDGRFLAITDWEAADLVIREISTGRERHVAKGGYPNNAEESAFSRDSRQVAYSWYKAEAGRYDLRVVSVTGEGEPRVVFDNEDVAWLMPCDWSPDGNWIAVQLTRKDRSSQMGVISSRDGSLRVLKSQEWFGAKKIFFSPDGKYLGFDLPVDGNPEQRDVYILAADGSRQVAAASGSSNETMMGWSPDGKYLLFASDRGGTTSLWSVAIADGKPNGTPEMIKSDISRISLGISTSGNLYTAIDAGDRDVRIAEVDFQTGKLISPPVRRIQNYVGTNDQPSWSIDGKLLAFRSKRTQKTGGSDVVGIMSIETGKIREIKPAMQYFENPRWTVDGKSLIVNGKDLKGRQGPVIVDLQTGETAPFPGQSTADGKRYPLKDLGSEGFAIMELDVASGVEREIVRSKERVNRVLSPDGRFIVTSTTSNDSDYVQKPAVISVVSIADGKTRELMRVTQSKPAPPVYLTWMPDSHAVVLTRLSGNKRDALLVPIDGSAPRSIDVGATLFDGFVQIHPDGRHIAYVSQTKKQEVWVLENFLSKTKPGN